MVLIVALVFSFLHFNLITLKQWRGSNFVCQQSMNASFLEFLHAESYFNVVHKKNSQAKTYLKGDTQMPYAKILLKL